MACHTDYTDFRLTHATAEHLHATSTTKFIGPIPHGWFETHKRSWLRPRTNYHRNDQAVRTDRTGSEEVKNLASCPRWLAETSLTRLSEDVGGTVNFSDQTSSSSNSLLVSDSAMPTLSDTRALEVAGANAATSPGAGDFMYSSTHDTEPTISAMPSFLHVSADLSDKDKTIGTQYRAITFESSTQPKSRSDRPMINVTSPTSGISTRESSTVSTASFATAPETLEEQAQLIRNMDELNESENELFNVASEADGEEQSDDDVSESSTIRYHPKIEEPSWPVGASAKNEIAPSGPSRAGTYSPLETGDYANPASNQTTSSSDANSRKSLLNHGERTATENSAQPSSHVSRPVAHLVRFQTEPMQASASGLNEDHTREGISAEGEEIHKRSVTQQHRRNFGYLNQGLLRNPFRKVKEPGELLRAERMLLRVECARERGVPEDYNEAKANRVERFTSMHWREFVLAARENEQGLVVLSFHRNRTVPLIAKSRTTVKATVQITLDPRTTKTNLYSSLDKTIVIWQDAKKARRGTMIYILRPCTTHASIEWYAFMKTRMNIKPSPVATIQVPNLNMSLRLELAANIKTDLQTSNESVMSSRSSSASLIDKTVEMNDMGQIVTAGVPITGEYLIKTCWDMLVSSNEWADVLADWKRNEKMGLCWRRYDRLEWIHGHNARQLIGQWAMQASHELELRPKEHYPTKVKLPTGEFLQEPFPIEGFLVRLTGSTGRQARFGKVFYKKLYFSSHDSLLFFSTPAKATPPPPPGFNAGTNADAESLLTHAPLIYDVEPYTLSNGEISWLKTNLSPEEVMARDHIAFTESARRTAQLQASDGFIDLSQVVRIRRCHQSRDDKENNIKLDGTNVHFHTTGAEQEELLASDEGITNEFDDDRVFELVLSSGLVIRLQSFDTTTRQAWMEHLSRLVKYWKWRHKADSAAYQRLRKANLEVLQIDEEVEWLVGQYARKWEVSPCVSEPQIYNFCPVSSCRTIALKGVLYRKPRVHSTFRKYECVISHGQMLIYNHTIVDAAGTVIPRIHHSRKEVLDLRDCYIYSGDVTNGDLLGTRESSDRDGLGRHSLPRLFQDGWTSQDEQESLCFVIWTGRRRTAFSGADKEDRKTSDNSVSRLGTAGKSMIYMARCRQERDLWVQILATEIERNTSVGLA